MRLLFVLLLAGCAASQWAKPGAGSRDFYRDDDLCVAQARPSPKGALEKPTYDACMVARGWQRK